MEVRGARRARSIVAVLVLALATLAACSDDTKVGSGVKTDGKEGGGSGALGSETTTTTRPSGATTAPPGTGATTTARPATTTTTRAATAITIKIQADTAGHPFEPVVAQVPKGSIVRWVNTDKEPRSVVAANGAFESPMLGPGGTFEWKAGAPGTYNYGDGTRPYAQGQVQVT